MSPPKEAPAKAVRLNERVSALWIDPRGPYPKLVVDCWDETRDARAYTGANPIVAHPPCGPWGRLRHLSRKDSPEHAPLAVGFVRICGGVLEHPAGSLLWKHCELPAVGAPPDAFGGYSIEVCQCDWGHVAQKRTWLYIVGCSPDLLPPRPAPREPTHWISGGRGRAGKKAKTTPVPPGIKVCSAQQRRRTPPAFAEWLIAIAERCGRCV